MDAADATQHPDKRLSLAKARAALLGAPLYYLEDDRGDPLVVISKWNLTRQFAGVNALADAEAWLDCLEGKASAA